MMSTNVFVASVAMHGAVGVRTTLPANQPFEVRAARLAAYLLKFVQVASCMLVLISAQPFGAMSCTLLIRGQTLRRHLL